MIDKKNSLGRGQYAKVFKCRSQINFINDDEVIIDHSNWGEVQACKIIVKDRFVKLST